MRVLPPTPAAIDEVARLLRAGGIAVIPTETVYGLAGSATSEAALARIFAVKDRPRFDPLIVHVPAGSATVEGLLDLGLVDGAALTRPARVRAAALLAAFAPGPLTLVLPRGARVPDLATSGLPTVAVRSPRHPVAQAVLAAAGPLAAPSANRFGRISPTSAADVVAELDGRVDVVLDGGACAIGVESTIVAVGADGALLLLRPGGAPADAIEAVAGARLHRATHGVQAPGMLPSHYAPRKRLLLLPAPVAALDQLPPEARAVARLGLLAFHPESGGQLVRLAGREITVRTLPAAVDQAARGLFAALRALDDSDAELLLAEPCPTDEGLGHAIADRLGRAAALCSRHHD